MAARGWEQSVTSRRPHGDTSTRSDTHQRSFTRVGNRPGAAVDYIYGDGRFEVCRSNPSGDARWNREIQEIRRLSKSALHIGCVEVALEPILL